MDIMNKELIDLYNQRCNKKSDINEHLPTLKEYSSRVNHVTELGVRFGVSTIALLAGEPKVLKSYDINAKRFKLYKKYKQLAMKTEFIFTEADVLKINIDPTDLLFIDTWHIYNQLKDELRLHSSKVRRYIIFHDVITFGNVGEDGSKPGLMTAINEFLCDNNEWKIEKFYKNNNGLCIISKK